MPVETGLLVGRRRPARMGLAVTAVVRLSVASRPLVELCIWRGRVLGKLSGCWSGVGVGLGRVRLVPIGPSHGLGVLEESSLACSALAAHSLRNSSTFRLPGIGEPSAAIQMRPIFLGPSGRICGFFTQVQFGPPIILLGSLSSIGGWPAVVSCSSSCTAPSLWGFGSFAGLFMAPT